MKHVMTPILNPLTDEYYQLKQLVLGREFPWFYETNPNELEEGYYFYSHVFLERPHPDERFLYPNVRSQHIDLFHTFLQQIFEYNNLPIDSIYRMNANNIPAQDGCIAPHVDHTFPHKNLIIYLTDAGGKTFVGDDVHDPVEDDIVIFSGIHYNERPKNKRRVVLVATYGDSSSYDT